ncbi:MAG: transglutaminase domain-containing protein, partial [Candidatus Eremiobacteraeota bacterium]|nr:transglutaminase domain-containing protein [Candidatus Eremiobacteraeota bacterium]
MRRFRWLALMLAVLVLWAPLRAQEPGDNLPPLNLPPLPGEEGPGEDLNLPDPNEERPDIPPPPPPLPIPEGPAVVKPNIPVSGNRFFKLMYGDDLVGYSTFQVSSTMKLGGEEFVILQSQGEMKLGFGAVVPSTFYSKLALDRTDLRPSYYKCMQKSGGNSFEVECVYSDTMVAQTNRTGDAKSVHFHNYDGRPPALLFNNLWGHIDTFPEHYWLLVRSAVNGGTLDAYDPILRGGGKLVVYEPKSETVDWNGAKLNTKVYPVSDLKGTLLARVRVKADDLELLEVDEVGSGLRMVRTDSNVVAKADKVKGVDLLSHRVVPSNVVFSDPERLTSLEADVEISLRGGQFADHRIPGYRQYFTGELREGYMKGRVVVRSVPRQGGYTTKFPLKGPLTPEIEAYTKPGPGVESEFPALVLKARELTWKSGTTFEAARRLMNFTSQVEEGVSLPSARYALESGVGNPESKALLLIAMARAAGLPARRVGGLLFRDGPFVPHHWADVWLGESET